jgi:hypothetical protein
VSRPASAGAESSAGCALPLGVVAEDVAEEAEEVEPADAAALVEGTIRG